MTPISRTNTTHAPSPEAVDLLIRAGAIYPMAQDRIVYRAIALHEQWIVAASPDPHGLDALCTVLTRVLSVPHLTLLPAFHDTHNHLIFEARNQRLVPVDQAHNLAELIALIGERAQRTPAGSWIRTTNGWHQSHLSEKRLPTARELDEATREHPVLLMRGGHVAVLNSLALKLVGITQETPDPGTGLIERFSSGEPSGVLIGPPAWAALAQAQEVSPFEEQVEDLKRACQRYHALGIGTVRDPLVTPEHMLLYQALWERGELSMRSRLMLAVPMAGTLADKIRFVASWGVRSGFGDDILRLWGLKLALDGGVENAALSQPYTHQPTFSGQVLWDLEELVEFLTFAVQRGWKVGTHVCGDRAVRMLLDAYERVNQTVGPLKLGTLVMEHALLAPAEQRARAIRLGVPVTVQHPLLDTMGAQMLTQWGPLRTREVLPVRAWLEEGAQVAAGTDYPAAASPDPMRSIWGLVTRGTREVGIQGPEYAIDRYTAISLYTAAGARLNGESQSSGTLEPSHFADLVAFERDPMCCPIDELLQLRPILTMVAGRVVYDPQALLSSTRLGRES